MQKKKSLAQRVVVLERQVKKLQKQVDNLTKSCAYQFKSIADDRRRANQED